MRYSWTFWTAVAPSPTAEATRLGFVAAKWALEAGASRLGMRSQLPLVVLDRLG